MKTISDYGEAKMKVAVSSDAIGKRLATLDFFIAGEDNSALQTMIISSSDKCIFESQFFSKRLKL